MAEAWRAVSPRRHVERMPGSRRRVGPFLTELKTRLGLEGGFSKEHLARGCTASVNLGAAGVALGLTRISCATDDPELLAAAQVWIRIALAEARTARGFSGVGGAPVATALRKVSLHHSS